MTTIKRHYTPLNCSKCGRFIGKDGFDDVYFDDATGMLEIGYPLCKRCLDQQRADKQRAAP